MTLKTFYFKGPPHCTQDTGSLSIPDVTTGSEALTDSNPVTNNVFFTLSVNFFPLLKLPI